MTVIEIKPYRNGWKVFEAPGVESVFLTQEQAINYAQNRASFRSGEIRILDSNGGLRSKHFSTERKQVNPHWKGESCCFRSFARS